MRILILLLVAALPFTISAQDDGYTMYESVRMQPNNTDLAGLKKAMSEHNKTYHNADPYTAVVWHVSTGPDIGNIVWMMGPCTYTDLDSRPSGEHDVHWASQVLPHIKYSKNGEYWKRDDDLSYKAGTQTPMVQISYLEIREGEGDRIQGILKKVSDAVKAADDGRPWSVYYNEFRQGWKIGRHIALVSGVGSWSVFDEPDTFREDYEKHHGENTWNAFTREWNDVFADGWDEIWTLSTDMSGVDTE
jgi:hypothetical protein